MDTEIDSVLTAVSLKEIAEIKIAVAELAEKAKVRIADENRDTQWVWACPKCGEDTFVVEDSVDTCYTCRHQEPTAECPECRGIYFASQMVPLADAFDWDYCEGRYELINDYGYSAQDVCPECLRKISADIECKRQDEYYENMR